MASHAHNNSSNLDFWYHINRLLDSKKNSCIYSKMFKPKFLVAYKSVSELKKNSVARHMHSKSSNLGLETSNLNLSF